MAAKKKNPGEVKRQKNISISEDSDREIKLFISQVYADKISFSKFLLMTANYYIELYCKQEIENGNESFKHFRPEKIK
jgi:hypothetical protein